MPAKRTKKTRKKTRRKNRKKSRKKRAESFKEPVDKTSGSLKLSALPSPCKNPEDVLPVAVYYGKVNKKDEARGRRGIEEAKTGAADSCRNTGTGGKV